MFLWFCLLLFVQLTSGKKGLIQEILQADHTATDVLASTRSSLGNEKAIRVNQIDNFDAVAKQSKQYVQKVSGFFKAPETGEYKFYSSCSGSCDIYIGQENSLKPRKIISQKEESLHNEFNRYPDQVSHTIYLEKDKLYFIQGIEKQNGGGLGHLSVGVVLPSDKQVFPISKAYLRTDTQSDGKRKEEISRDSKGDLTSQRDTMFKKLREINDYIQNLTDEVKRKSTEQPEAGNSNQDSLSPESSKPDSEKAGLAVGNEALINSDQSMERTEGKTTNDGVTVDHSSSGSHKMLEKIGKQMRLSDQRKNDGNEITGRNSDKGETSEAIQRQEGSQTLGVTEGKSGDVGHGANKEQKQNTEQDKTSDTADIQQRSGESEKVQPEITEQSSEQKTNIGNGGIELLKEPSVEVESTQETQPMRKYGRPKTVGIHFGPIGNTKSLDGKGDKHNGQSDGETEGNIDNKVAYHAGVQSKSEEEPTVIAVIEKSKAKPESPKDVDNQNGGAAEDYQTSNTEREEPEKKEVSNNAGTVTLGTHDYTPLLSGSIQHQTDVTRANDIQNAALEHAEHGNVNIAHATHGLIHDKHDMDSVYPSTNVLLEHGYIKLHKSGHASPFVHANGAVSLHPEEQDDEDVMQLTNYAKEEIAKHGNLSEGVIRHLVRIIKQKILSDGITAFNKRQNMTGMQENHEKSRNTENSRESNEDKGSVRLTDKQTEQDMPKLMGKEHRKIDIYDHVISNLMKSLKKNLLPQRSDRSQKTAVYEKQDASNGPNQRSKFKSTSQISADDYVLRNNRIIASLNHLSGELENLKTFLRTKQEPVGLSDGQSMGEKPKDASIEVSPSGITPNEANTNMNERNKFNSGDKQDATQYENQQSRHNSAGVGSGMEEKQPANQIPQESQAEQTGMRKDRNPPALHDAENGIRQAALTQSNADSSTGQYTNSETTNRYTQSSDGAASKDASQSTEASQLGQVLASHVLTPNEEQSSRKTLQSGDSLSSGQMLPSREASSPREVMASRKASLSKEGLSSQDTLSSRQAPPSSDAPSSRLVPSPSEVSSSRKVMASRKASLSKEGLSSQDTLSSGQAPPIDAPSSRLVPSPSEVSSFREVMASRKASPSRETLASKDTLLSREASSSDALSSRQVQTQNEVSSSKEVMASRKALPPNDALSTREAASPLGEEQVSRKAIPSREVISSTEELQQNEASSTRQSLPLTGKGQTISTQEPMQEPTASNQLRNKDSGSLYSADSQSLQQSTYEGDKDESAMDKKLDKVLDQAEAILSPNSYQSVLLKTVSNENGDGTAELGGRVNTQDVGQPDAKNGIPNENSVPAIASNEEGTTSSNDEKQGYNANSLAHQLNSARILSKLRSQIDQNYDVKLLQNTVDQVLAESSKEPVMENRRKDQMLNPGKPVKLNSMPRDKNIRSMIRKTKFQPSYKHRGYKDEKASKKTEIMKHHARKLKTSRRTFSKRGRPRRKQQRGKGHRRLL